MTNTEKKAYNKAVTRIISQICNTDCCFWKSCKKDNLCPPVEKLLKMRKPIETKTFRLTDETMVGDCPQCGGSWKGASFLHSYKELCAQNNIEATDEEIQEHIYRQKYINDNMSLLIQDIEKGLYTCPHCRHTFVKCTNE